MAKLLRSGLFADVTFRVDREDVPAHRSLLAARSDYFCALFSSSFADSTSPVVAVEGVGAAAFRTLLQFLYTNDMSLTDDLVVEVMQLAHQYHLPAAYAMCLQHCQRQLTTTTALPWLVQCHRSQLEEPHAFLLRYALVHASAILATARPSLDLLLDYPELMLQIITAFCRQQSELI